MKVVRVSLFALHLLPLPTNSWFKSMRTSFIPALSFLKCKQTQLPHLLNTTTQYRSWYICRLLLLYSFMKVTPRMVILQTIHLHLKIRHDKDHTHGKTKSCCMVKRLKRETHRWSFLSPFPSFLVASFTESSALHINKKGKSHWPVSGPTWSTRCWRGGGFYSGRKDGRRPTAGHRGSTERKRRRKVTKVCALKSLTSWIPLRYGLVCSRWINQEGKCNAQPPPQKKRIVEWKLSTT